MTGQTAQFIWRALVCGALCLMGPVHFAVGQEGAGTPAGLMWNRTGLPAVFPLLVKTPEGRDYYLTLSDTETGQDALAAFVTGGAFFRVLVPPGTYDVRFASGETWIDEGNLFGAGEKTDVFALDQPLTFAIRDFATKAGHSIDIMATGPGDAARIEVSDQYLCQTSRIVNFPRLQPEFDGAPAYKSLIPDATETRRFPSRFSQERLRDRGDEPAVRTQYAPYFSRPDYEVRSDLC